MTTCKNNEVISLLRKGFDANGYIVAKGSKARQAAAKAILENESMTASVYGTMVDGYDTIGSLQIMAYPKMTL